MADKLVLVTGATGFVGSHAVRRLLSRGWRVAALVPAGEAGPQVDAPQAAGLTIVRGGLADLDAWAPEVSALRPQSCLHLAWLTTPGAYLESEQNLAWLSWSAGLYARLTDWGVRHVVGVGTCAEYDADQGYLRETGPVRPLSLYAACKLSLHQIGERLAARKGFTSTWARIFHLYGPGEHPDRLVAACIRTLLAGESFPATAGTQVRDFLHVKDVAAGLVALLEQSVEGAVNVCSGQPVTVRAMLELIAQAVGRPELLRLGARPSPEWDPPFLCGDNRRLRAQGWQQEFMLDEGIADAVAWWRQRLNKEPDR
jgi:nucleoside-diphosphate-sugar epimerase